MRAPLVAITVNSNREAVSADIVAKEGNAFSKKPKVSMIAAWSGSRLPR
jgi:hypothetical protein